LKILTKGNKDKDGALLAVVVAANIGDLASVLVDNGLAAVLKPASRPGADPKRREEQNIQALKEREAAAIRRPIPAGAWALAPEGPKS
jgi:endonuclease YncB( thermonuclease family)